MTRLHTDRARAESFGAVAETYDRARPGYPAALVDDLLALARPRTALDVGCGTGKAAAALIERGVAVLGLEIDPQMAAVARRNGVPVEVGALERWDPAGREFDLVVAGQTWHWIDPVLGPAAAASVLHCGGLLALFWNYGRLPAALRRVVEAAYTEVAPQLLRSSAHRGAEQTLTQITTDLAASGRFARIERREYGWQQRYSAAGYAELLTTHSDHRQLPPQQLDRLARRVRAACENRGGAVPVDYRTQAVLAFV